MSDISKPGDVAFFGRGDEGYFEEESRRRGRAFDARLLQEPISVVATRAPLIFAQSASTSSAMRAMQSEHSGVVLVTPGWKCAQTPLVGIFTERDILLRVINRGRNPAETPLSEIMSDRLEVLQSDARLAWVLNMMSVGGFRHVPLVNSQGLPVGVVSVRDIVEFLVASFPSEILNLPPDFGVRRHLPRDGA